MCVDDDCAKMHRTRSAPQMNIRFVGVDAHYLKPGLARGGANIVRHKPRFGLRSHQVHLDVRKRLLDTHVACDWRNWSTRFRVDPI